ncbi:MAG: TRAP transporter substrate-binding protein [Ruminiclostridium sp.]|nr:TRAP transporter substrate-binding protein [Ruminiclostridium sp.]
MVILSLTAGMRSGPKMLTYAEMNNLDGTVPGEMAKAFKEKVEELSGGSLIIDIQANGVLGSEDQLIDNLLGGGNITDFTRITASALTQYGCDKAALLGIPYTFVDDEHFYRFAESELAQEILLEPREIGLPIRGLCYAQEGFRNFFFKKEIKGLDDLKNLKLRVSSDPVMTGMVDDLGAYATPVAFTELYSALSSGVVDGAEQPIPNYLSNAFPEVAPNLLLDGHTLGVMQIVMAEYSWEKLSEEEQGWVEEGAKYASRVAREKVDELIDDTMAQLREKNVNIVEVEDKTPWVEACRPVIEEYTSGNRELYQRIVDMKQGG